MCVITVIGVAAAATFSRACDAKTFSARLGKRALHERSQS